MAQEQPEQERQGEMAWEVGPEEASVDLSGPPCPAPESLGRRIGRGLCWAGLGIGAGVLALAILTPNMARGATVSARLKWEERQRQMADAMSDVEAPAEAQAGTELTEH